MGTTMKFIVGIVATVTLAACGCPKCAVPNNNPLGDPQVARYDAPGVVPYAWEEPMVDVVDVPPGLDPEGHYYRPSHQEIVEIRQGRWQYYRPRGDDAPR